MSEPYWEPLAAAARSLASFLHFQYRQPTGTNGGSNSIAAWTKYPLNTEVSDDDNVGALASSVITLAPGTYEVDGWASFYQTTQTQLRLRNTTDGVTLLIGTAVYRWTGSSGDAFLKGKFTIAAGKNLEIQYWATT